MISSPDHRGTNIMYQLRSYTKTQNKAHIRQSVTSIPTKLPVGIIQLLASIPESLGAPSKDFLHCKIAV